MTFHAGDTRIYKISSDLRQLTDDHTFINREIKRGNMTPQQAKTDPRRNALIRCIGASGEAEPEVKFGNLESGANYMICSDGFRHVLEPKEIYDELSPKRVKAKQEMERSLRDLIELVKTRSERDNITAAMFRAEF
jgi:serine/threonine protein phosphatase PrpC